MSAAAESWEKDAVLNDLATSRNVAQFLSFDNAGDLRQRFCRIAGIPADRTFESPARAIELLLDRSAAQQVNVRTFRHGQTKGNEFLYGLSDVHEILEKIERLTQQGWKVIVNETIDVNDGGVSGVAFGDALEFAPGDTPRCVEKPGTCRVERALGLEMLEVVYGFKPALQGDCNERIEFSIHPKRHGVLREHTIIWESELLSNPASAPKARWPNRFSRLVGDKTFGLLLASSMAVAVPRTVAVGRAIAPFVFGATTGTSEYWLRTAPAQQNPGRFITTYGWVDPFGAISKDEHASEANAPQIASVLSQESVDAIYSGGAASVASGDVIVEGVSGFGAGFMLGERRSEHLPTGIMDDVKVLVRSIEQKIGPIRIEWAHDGRQPWLLQLHVGAIEACDDVIVSGVPAKWVEFNINQGLAKLRHLIASFDSETGVRLIGDVGVTSHFGDLLRSRSIPAVVIRQQ